MAATPRPPHRRNPPNAGAAGRAPPAVIVGGNRIPFARTGRRVHEVLQPGHAHRGPGRPDRPLRPAGRADRGSGRRGGAQALPGFQPDPGGRARLRAVRRDPRVRPAAGLRHRPGDRARLANKIKLGQIDSAIAGGVDSASDAPIAVSEGLREVLLDLNRAKTLPQRLQAPQPAAPAKDLAPDAPSTGEPRTGLSMGEHQALTTAQWEITREAQDELALNSHRNLAAAYDAGFFDDLLTPYRGPDPGRQPARDTTLEKLATLKPVFGKDLGAEATMTAGNSTPLTDGASTVLLASEEWAARARPAHARARRGRRGRRRGLRARQGGPADGAGLRGAAAAGAQRPDPAGLRLLRDPRGVRRHRAEHAGGLGGRGILPHTAGPGRRVRQHRPRPSSTSTAPRWPPATRSPPPAGGSWPRWPRCCTRRAPAPRPGLHLRRRRPGRRRDPGGALDTDDATRYLRLVNTGSARTRQAAGPAAAGRPAPLPARAAAGARPVLVLGDGARARAPAAHLLGLGPGRRRHAVRRGERLGAIMLVLDELAHPADLDAGPHGHRRRRCASWPRAGGVVVLRRPRRRTPTTPAAGRGPPGRRRAPALARPRNCAAGATANGIVLGGDAERRRALRHWARCGSSCRAASAYVDGQFLRVGLRAPAPAARRLARSRWPARSPWSPGPPAASARPLPDAAPATAPRWSSSTSRRGEHLARRGQRGPRHGPAAGHQPRTTPASGSSSTPRERHGRLDIVVHNAGITRDKLLANMDAAAGTP